MSAHIAGAGWVTPLGSNIDEVWERLNQGDQAEPETIVDEASATSYRALKVPTAALAGLPAHPRLRRASAISRFSASAGLAAMEDARAAGLTIDPERIALVFAISNGGVIYTRRFYHEIVASGASSASPILFPETVFNAPASHLAALLGVTGQTYTLVGDGSVGVSAVNLAEALLADAALAGVLVVGAEEIDWLLCDAYNRWRLLKKISAKNNPESGMILSEGAGALFLSQSGSVRIESSHAALHYERRRDLKGRLKSVINRMNPSSRDVVVGSSNGTFIDRQEKSVVRETFGDVPFYSPKAALGESVGASGLWQTIVAMKALRGQRLPQNDGGHAVDSRPLGWASAVVISCGLNQGVSALRLVV